MNFSKYSNNTSGYSSEISSSLRSQVPWSGGQLPPHEPLYRRASAHSLDDIKLLTPSIDLAMEEFKMNGIDSPYDPDEDQLQRKYKDKSLIGMGPPDVYLRQKSWPAPEASPAVALPKPPDYRRWSTGETFQNVATTAVQAKIEDLLTEQQLQVLSTLPNSVLYYLLKQLEQSRVGQEGRPKPDEQVECRLCKNNGEREAFYRSHRLRWRGRVVCPVLRALRCPRCGARGDSAHTLKYCPLTTADERAKSTAMMRSFRSGHRRNAATPSSDAASERGFFGEVVPNVLTDGAADNKCEPLDPIWEALAKKLLITNYVC